MQIEGFSQIVMELCNWNMIEFMKMRDLFCMVTCKSYVDRNKDRTLDCDPKAKDKDKYIYPHYPSDGLKQLLSCLLEEEPERRPEWDELLEMKWLTEGKATVAVTIDDYITEDQGETFVYNTLPECGTGTSSTVYQGFSTNKLGRVAVKVIKKNYRDNHDDLLRNEARVLHILQCARCSNIIRFYGLQTVDTMCFVFEYCQSTLSRVIASGLSEYQARKFFRERRGTRFCRDCESFELAMNILGHGTAVKYPIGLTPKTREDKLKESKELVRTLLQEDP